MFRFSRLFLASMWDASKMALDSMRAHKMRAFLTLIGVVIGVTTIIAMMTVLGGIKNAIDTNMRSQLSVNVFQVQQNEPNIGIHIGWRREKRRPPIEARYADAIRERCPAVRRVGVEVWEFGQQIRRGGLETNANMAIAGGSVEFGDNNGMYVVQGRPVTEQDINSSRRVIVLGEDVRHALFENVNPLGQMVRIGAEQFEVIGVFEKRGSLLGESHDNQSWIPLSTFMRIFGKYGVWGERSVNLTVQSWSAELYDEAIQEVTECMRVERGLKPGQPNNFAFFTPDMLQESFNNLTGWIGYAAFGICAISLLVAGIGIMNIMLVSVTERTREIGLRKAVGGTKTSILRQFLIESVMLSEVGGAIGILLGYLLAVAVNAQLKYPAPVPIWSVFLAILFCSFVGVGFGMWPAIRAARLDPIEALRHE
ncbi:MAG TPA: ABC transporter permease [bacterium]|jgi:putative ABC transport system permease protein